MENLKVVKLENDVIIFENGTKLYSNHHGDCCEQHYLSMDDLTISDFEGCEFDFSNDNFFRRIEGYGIELVPVTGFSVKIPGYADNNGYYSSDLYLVLEHVDSTKKVYDITECQDY